MPDTRWKDRERAAAKLLGTSRPPNNGHAQCDLIAGRFAVEHKSRESLPVWLIDAVVQAKRNAPDGLTPAVILTASAGQGRMNHRLVVLDLGDLSALLNGEPSSAA